MTPKFLLPTTSGLSLALLSGCGLFQDPIVGTWHLERLDGDPTSYSDRYDGCDYTVRLDVNLTIEEEKSGDFSGKMSYSNSEDIECDDGSSYSYSEDGGSTRVSDVLVGDDGRYVISFSSNDFKLDCTINDDDNLHCDDDGSTLLFARAD